MADTALGDVGVSLFVAGAAFGDVGDVGAPRLANAYFAVQGVVPE